jgi:hypothetical protein
MVKAIYLLPGKGGRLNKGVGEALSARGYDVFGRELYGEFRNLSFADQIDIVATDLQTSFWHEDAKVIANSFGAYLFLHAQTLLESFVGRVLLLSPIIGEVANEEHMMFFIPPRSRRIQDLVRAGAYPAPACCEIHVGELDWQSDPEKVTELGRQLGMKVTVVPGAGHRLPIDYVGATLDAWLANAEAVCSEL